MEDNFSNYFSETGKVAKEYLETRLAIIKLQAAGKLSKAMGLFFSLVMAFLLFFFVVVFLGMVLGFWIGEKTGSMTLGFSCAAGLFVLLFVVLLIGRKSLIQRPLANLLAAELVESGFDINRLFIWPAGNSRRNFSRDVQSVEWHHLEHAHQSLLCIKTSREGLYDMLPEGLFHQPVPYSSTRSTEEIIDQIRRYKEEEQQARRFFPAAGSGDQPVPGAH